MDILDDSKLYIRVTKEDGSVEDYDDEKLANSIFQAACNVGGEDYDLATDIAEIIRDELEEGEIDEIDTESLRTIVETTLINEGHAKTAISYIEEANRRSISRERKSKTTQAYTNIIFSDGVDSDLKRENANINSDTPMGIMLKMGSEASKEYNLLELISEDIANAHRNGDIHIHDLDFYNSTETCCQIPLNRLFKNGFNTGHGFLRTPARIGTAGALAAIAIQSNQNDQHGGQSIPLFDYYLAPYVAISHVKNIAHILKIKAGLTKDDEQLLRSGLLEYQRDNLHVMNKKADKDIRDILVEASKELSKKVSLTKIKESIREAYEETDNETYQAMEAFIHNLNTMHSRAGAQVPFSSVNYGTDTSTEGRLVMINILKSTDKGLGNGETPIFPIQIFKLKAGVNLNPDDPNYDIFDLACKVSAKRLYPNFVNCDATYNAEMYVPGNIETEIATMGCRTRVGLNKYDPTKSVVPGRGNLSFTSINLPRLGILANHDIDKFYRLLDSRMELVHRELLERFEVQCMRHPKNYPFLMGQGVWLDSDKLGPNDDIRSILKHGTLTVGFIGLAETLIALIGKHHGESEEAQKLGLEIIGHMRQMTDAWSEEEKMNYSIIGTPAEGLSGRFVAMDKKKFGIIPGVTDKKYYTNSSHVPVYYEISAFDKIDIEAPYHELENGGHILYIELDGDPTKNISAFKKIVTHMHDKNAGYFAINHPVDRDPACGYVGIIGDKCPRCGRRDGEPMTYEMWEKLQNKFAYTGNADTVGFTGDHNEEADRVPNKLG